jgi:hypothetical protein
MTSASIVARTSADVRAFGQARHIAAKKRLRCRSGGVDGQLDGLGMDA